MIIVDNLCEWGNWYDVHEHTVKLIRTNAVLKAGNVNNELEKPNDDRVVRGRGG